MMVAYHYTDLELKLRAECEQDFAVGPHAVRAVSPTGETYTEFTNPDHKGVASEDEVYRLALKTFRKYAKGRTGVIYWRVCPEISRAPVKPSWRSEGGWKFYMRLLISDKPVVALASAEELR